ncbi:MAG: hypothetical protein AAF604_03085 [Acidobacteriota bacterium]
MGDRGGIGCGKLFLGCGCLVLILLLVSGLTLALNPDLLKSTAWYQKAEELAAEGKGAMQFALTLREELLSIYPAEDLGVNWNWSNESGKTLAVEIVNPAFADDENADWNAIALEIARYTASAHGKPEELEGIQVVITQRVTAGVSFSKEQDYYFSMEEIGDLGLRPQVEATPGETL